MRKIITREMNRLVVIERRYGKAIELLIKIVAAIGGAVIAIVGALLFFKLL